GFPAETPQPNVPSRTSPAERPRPTFPGLPGRAPRTHGRRRGAEAPRCSSQPPSGAVEDSHRRGNGSLTPWKPRWPTMPAMKMGPLGGFTIAVTAERRAAEQIDLLERRGARVVHAPTVRGVPMDDDGPVRQATEALVAVPPDGVV